MQDLSGQACRSWTACAAGRVRRSAETLKGASPAPLSTEARAGAHSARPTRKGKATVRAKAKRRAKR